MKENNDKREGVTVRMLAISAALALVFTIAMVWLDPLDRRADGAERGDGYSTSTLHLLAHPPGVSGLH